MLISCLEFYINGQKATLTISFCLLLFSCYLLVFFFFFGLKGVFAFGWFCSLQLFFAIFWYCYHFDEFKDNKGRLYRGWYMDVFLIICQVFDTRLISFTQSQLFFALMVDLTSLENSRCWIYFMEIFRSICANSSLKF